MKKLIFGFALVFSVIPCQARIITVDDDGPAEFTNIQAAIDDANNGDVVEVQPGTYTDTGNRNIDFKGKAITVRSTDPNDHHIVAITIISCNGTANPHRGFYFHSGETASSRLSGMTIILGYATHGGGIYCNGASPTITNNVIAYNTASSTTITPSSRGGGICCINSSAIIMNNLIIWNRVRGLGGGICADSASIINNTITDNDSVSASFESSVGGIYCTGSSSVVNTIVWGNSGKLSPKQILGCTNVTYSDIEGGYEGEGNIDADPCFAYGSRFVYDYHLKSQAGRWNPNSQNWVYDEVTSPCIDAGNPGCPVGNEPVPNGNRINMGAYGGTAEASKSPENWRSIADLTNDWAVDFNDLKVFVDYWLETGECIPSDLNRNQLVNLSDFAIFADNWLWQ